MTPAETLLADARVAANVMSEDDVTFMLVAGRGGESSGRRMGGQEARKTAVYNLVEAGDLILGPRCPSSRALHSSLELSRFTRLAREEH